MLNCLWVWLSYKLSNILWHLIWFWLWLLIIYLIVGELDIWIILSRKCKLRYSFTFMIFNSMVNNVNQVAPLVEIVENFHGIFVRDAAANFFVQLEKNAITHVVHDKGNDFSFGLQNRNIAYVLIDFGICVALVRVSKDFHFQ